MRPHYSHSSRENATPSSGTSPLASCKGVPPRGITVTPQWRLLSVNIIGSGGWTDDEDIVRVLSFDFSKAFDTGCLPFTWENRLVHGLGNW